MGWMGYNKMDENGRRKLTFNIRSDSEFRDFGNRAATVGFDEKMAPRFRQ